MLNLLEEDLDSIAKKRRDNYVMLYDRILQFDNIKPLKKILPEDTCPYVFPVIIKKNMKKIKSRLHQKGIPANNWPYLPTEISEKKNKYKNANWLYNNVLLLPTHQGLDKAQISYVLSVLKKALDD